tara:strand:- start:608 stop:808 length:201 start_codon:yes stop_codon:yes gene_type:complete
MEKNKVQIEPRCLNKAEAARYVGVSINTFHKLVADGQAPKPIQITEKRLVWDKKRLDEYIDNLNGF